MKIEKTKVPDLDDLPKDPRKAWEYGYSCAVHDIRLRMNLALSGARASIEEIKDCVTALTKD